MSDTYRATEPVKRLAMTMDSTDPRDPVVLDDDYQANVRAVVRVIRLRDMERCWSERSLSAFDQLVKLWHPFDSKLYGFLSDAPRLRAVSVLKKAGYL